MWLRLRWFTLFIDVGKVVENYDVCNDFGLLNQVNI